MKTLINEYRLIKERYALSGPAAVRFMAGNLLGGFSLSRKFWN